MKMHVPEFGVVIESYNHEKHQVVVTDSPLEAGHYFHFFYLPEHPAINFGDTILMDFKNEEFRLHHGNLHLTYKLSPCTFPDTLLYEILIERIPETQK